MEYDKALAKHNADRGAMDILRTLRELRPDVYDLAELVGRWVWVAFPDKPDRDTLTGLKNLGFRWNQRRGCWQHCGGVHTGRMRGYPKDKYITTRAADLEPTAA